MLERNRHTRRTTILNEREIRTRCVFKTRIIERKTRSLYIRHQVDDSNKSLFGYNCLGRNTVTNRFNRDGNQRYAFLAT